MLCQRFEPLKPPIEASNPRGIESIKSIFMRQPLQNILPFNYVDIMVTDTNFRQLLNKIWEKIYM